MRSVLKIFLHSIAFLSIWLLAITFSNSLWQIDIPEVGDPIKGLLLMWLCSLLEVIVLHTYLVSMTTIGWKRFLMILFTLFFIQFFLPQIETWFYLESTVVPHQLVNSTLLSGFLLSGLYSLLTHYTYPERPTGFSEVIDTRIWPLVLGLGVLIYPLIYFLAGYFIAWQWEAVRIYYTGSSDLLPFDQIMSANFYQGTYIFQTLRGTLWTIFGLVMITTLGPKDWKLQGIIMGLVFAIVMNAQHLLPNPYMPDAVRVAHALETTTSNFFWGMTIAFARFVWTRFSKPETVTMS